MLSSSRGQRKRTFRHRKKAGVKNSHEYTHDHPLQKRQRIYAKGLGP